MDVINNGNPVEFTLPPMDRALMTKSFLAMRKVSLIWKDNILRQTLWLSTIHPYIQSMAKLTTAHYIPNPAKGPAAKWTHPMLTNLEKYETAQNECEASTSEMIDKFHHCVTQVQANNFAESLYDWLALGYYTHFCQREWTESHKTLYE
jgi:hypothetical protein